MTPGRVLLLAHGYPPRERAGTEQHTATLAGALREAGVQVHVLAATRAPGRAQYEVIEEPGLTRVVNNVPARPLASEERDGAIDALVAAVIRRFKPDLVHVQHLQFLSSSLALPSPWVFTLHDAWAWCPAGGTLLNQGAPCPGPSPERCAPCAAAWAPTPGPLARGLMAGAGLLAPLVAPERLHRAWQRLPDAMRAPIRRGQTAAEPPSAAEARNQRFRELIRGAAARISPSYYLANIAEAQGLGPVTVVRHGVPDSSLKRRGDGPLLFLGTMAWHKGPDRVVSAWRRAFPAGNPPLRLVGPAQEQGISLGHPVEAPLDRAGVALALSEARALVLGSRWPENAPLVILEARAAGCPVIAPASGGIPELVEHGVDGLLYPPDDDEALSRAMAALVAAPPGPPRPPPGVPEMLRATLSVYSTAMG